MSIPVPVRVYFAKAATWASGLERLGLVRRFPGEGVFGAAEMAERRGLAIDRAAQLQVSIMPFGVSGKWARTSSTRRSSSTLPVPNVLTMTDTGSATPMA